MQGAEGFPPVPGSWQARKQGGWVVPTLIVVIGVLVVSTAATGGAWLKTRSDLRKLDAAAHTVANVGDSMIADLRGQVSDLQSQVGDLQTRLNTAASAGLQLAASLRSQLRAAQARAQRAEGCVQELADAQNRSTVYSFPREFSAALVGGSCRYLGYYYS